MGRQDTEASEATPLSSSELEASKRGTLNEEKQDVLQFWKKVPRETDLASGKICESSKLAPMSQRGSLQREMLEIRCRNLRTSLPRTIAQSVLVRMLFKEHEI